MEEVTIRVPYITQLGNFLRSRRKNDTRNYARTILLYLSQNIAQNEGWVRTKDLISFLTGKIPNESTMYQQLLDLQRYHLIEHKEGERLKGGKYGLHERGSPPGYFRVPIIYEEYWFLSREELIERLSKKVP